MDRLDIQRFLECIAFSNIQVGWSSPNCPVKRWRQLEQRTGERAFRESQHQRAVEPEQQHRLPRGEHGEIGSIQVRYGGLNRPVFVQARFPASGQRNGCVALLTGSNTTRASGAGRVNERATVQRFRTSRARYKDTLSVGLGMDVEILVACPI